jgi:hypothetical protein
MLGCWRRGWDSTHVADNRTTAFEFYGSRAGLCRSVAPVAGTDSPSISQNETLGMDLMDDSLLCRCHEAVDFQELRSEPPRKHTDPNSTTLETALTRPFSAVY